MQEKKKSYQQKRKNFSEENISSERPKSQNKFRQLKNSGKPLPKKQTNYQKIDKSPNYADFLPLCREDMEIKGWKELDVLLVSGDAYIDHPAFAAALLGRYLEHHGFKVGIITQPNWKDPNIVEQIKAMGRPRLFAGISAGAVDSMLAHYTAFRKKRHDDAYTPGGQCGARPNRAVTVYTSLLKQAFPNLPVIAGGIEASLRRLTHYDFWSDSIRKSILADAKLDLVVYGMGERALLEIAARLRDFYAKHPELVRDSSVLEKAKDKKPWQQVLHSLDGTCRFIKTDDIVNLPKNTVILPSHEDILRSPKLLLETALESEQHIHQGDYYLVQVIDKNRAVLVEKPAKRLTTEEMDLLYSLPFRRKAHPRYQGRIPAETMMKTSIPSHRGCGGGCSFCSLALHQGRKISSRSEQSLLDEAQRIANSKGFDGSISDIGGPSANMWQAFCALEQKAKTENKAFSCKRDSCMTPNLCPHFKADQEKHLALLRKVKKLPHIRNVRIASGVRFDLALQQKSALESYTGEFTGGQLKVAPEHCSESVLKLMRKPGMDKFETFLQAFYKHCKKIHKEQYVIPYLLSAFPGCTDENMRELAKWLKERNWKPQQVQCFIPTPGTVATAMFYAECDPKGNPIFVAKTDAARLRQHGILMGTAVHPEDDGFYN